MEIFPAPFFVLLNFLICKRKTKDMLKNSLLFSAQVCLKCQNQKFFCLYFLLLSIVFSSKFVRWMDVIYCKIFSHLSPLGDLWIAACSLQTPFSVTSALFHKEILENTELMKIQKNDSEKEIFIETSEDQIVEIQQCLSGLASCLQS